MITAVAFVPQAPALVPEIGRGLDAELGPVRDACRTAIRRIAAPQAPPRVDGDAAALPIARSLVDDALGRTSTAAASAMPAVPSALVVAGDGSACRSEKAPGYFDERAAGFDLAIADALRSGDPARLAGLDATLGARLLAAGVPTWQRVAAELDGRFDAELLYDDAPFGVGYFVAVWLSPGTSRARH